MRSFAVFGSLLAAAVMFGPQAGGSEARAPEIIRKTIRIEDCKIEYTAYADAGSGWILLNPHRATREGGIARLVVLDELGNVVFHRPFESFVHPLIASDFKEIEPGYFGYFVASRTGGGHDARWKSKYYFLDGSFGDVFLHPVPDYDPGLDPRWASHRPGGEYFFLFSRKRHKPATGVASEVEELNLRRNTPFSWNAEDYLPAHSKGEHDPLRIDSIGWDGASAMLLALPESHEIVKIAYPSGEIVWRLSSANWKFVGDERGGFQSPHSAVALEGGNVLLVDSDARAPGHAPRAVEYRLNPETRTATLVWQYVNPTRGPARTGEDPAVSIQRLSNGDTLVAWGTSMVSEINSKGEPVREWKLSDGYSVSSASLVAPTARKPQ